MLVDVEALTGYELVVPRQLAGAGIERQHGIGVEERRTLLFSPALAMPGLRLGRAPVGQVKDRVVGARDPGIAAAGAPLLGGDTLPGVASGLTRIRGRVEPPGSCAGLGIDRTDEATDPLGAIDTGDDLSLHCEPGARRRAVTITRIVKGGLERLRAIADVDGVDLAISRVYEGFVIIEHDPAAYASGCS